MGTIQFIDGDILFVDGDIAMHEDCCCPAEPYCGACSDSPPSYIQIRVPSAIGSYPPSFPNPYYPCVDGEDCWDIDFAAGTYVLLPYPPESSDSTCVYRYTIDATHGVSATLQNNLGGGDVYLTARFCCIKANGDWVVIATFGPTSISSGTCLDKGEGSFYRTLASGCDGNTGQYIYWTTSPDAAE